MDYVWTLFSLGVEPDLLEADPRFPDGCFVEDAAVLVKNVAVITRPGHPSRQGEEQAIEEVLEASFAIKRIEAPGTLDGGDVCRVGDHFFIGLSRRTNQEGVMQLARILKSQGCTSQSVPVVESLHLKSGLSWLGGDNLLVTEAYATRPELAGYRLITVAPEESYAANCLWINGVAVISQGYPKLKHTLQQEGFSTLELAMSEFRKMDGSLTCLSLLW